MFSRGVHPRPSGSIAQPPFQLPPFSDRPRLFCCPVAESNVGHLPRSFINPGRHLMNLQLRSFLECADEPSYTMPRCDVSHIIEVTSRTIHSSLSLEADSPDRREQWNVSHHDPISHDHNWSTPPSDKGDNMDQNFEEDIPYSTYHSMSTRCFVTQNSNNGWQVPPHSRQYRDSHIETAQGRVGTERYIEIPPFRTMPYTSDGSSGHSTGGLSARPWMPSCTIIMWCTQHQNYYEVHVLS